MLVSKTVEMRWSYRNRKHFESLGYEFTNINDIFVVNVEDLTTGSAARVTVKCDYCGKEYECYYYAYVKCHAILNKDACQSCSATKGREVNFAKRAHKYFTQLEELFKENGYRLITKESDYTDIFMDIEYECPSHGVVHGTLSNLLKGHMCNECGNDKIGDSLRNSVSYVKQYIENYNNNILLNPEDYINSGTRNLKIKCGTCGNIFVTSLGNYRRMTRKRCPTCNRRESEGEEIIRKYLTSKDICFVQEKTFDDCRDKQPLPFDFYLPDYKLCIEFDGQLHYEPKFGEERYNKTVAHDNMKNQYCKDNNIELLRIPYWNGHDIESIIDGKINGIKI